MVCANRDQTAREGGNSRFSGHPPPQPFLANSLPVPGELPPDDDRSDTIPK